MPRQRLAAVFFVYSNAIQSDFVASEYWSVTLPPRLPRLVFGKPECILEVKVGGAVATWPEPMWHHSRCLDVCLDMC